jgi:hypothetical protein
VVFPWRYPVPAARVFPRFPAGSFSVAPRLGEDAPPARAARAARAARLRAAFGSRSMTSPHFHIIFMSSLTGYRYRRTSTPRTPRVGFPGLGLSARPSASGPLARLRVKPRRAGACRSNGLIQEEPMIEPAAPDAETLALLTALYRDHPRWAIWLPLPGGQWTAVRPAGSRPPSPQMPMLWVHADTSVDLADQMRRADETLQRPFGT